MSESADEASLLQHTLERFAAGDETALNELLVRTSDRLEKMTRSMLNDFARVRRWEDTADVVQNASVRLFRAFQVTRPTDARGFFALATLQIRRELIDLVRHYFGPEGLGANHESRSNWPVGDNSSASPVEEGSGTLDPRRLSVWSEFHEQAGELPHEMREVFDLVYYQGLEQTEAAALLGISERTVRRRWQSAKEALNDALDGRMPV
ncbi:MAG: sigma-70 family RNA polymerase sigma factor [Planctomycetaceae bacterium]|nr:sigma-70 family RNA polymerase sigma factor [Planctomycetaceae bacterium]